MSHLQWKHYPNNCDLCGECIDTCGKALKISNLHRIVRNPELCNECETCSTICDNIQTEILREDDEIW